MFEVYSHSSSILNSLSAVYEWKRFPKLQTFILQTQFPSLCIWRFSFLSILLCLVTLFLYWNSLHVHTSFLSFFYWGGGGGVLLILFVHFLMHFFQLYNRSRSSYSNGWKGFCWKLYTFFFSFLLSSWILNAFHLDDCLDLRQKIYTPH